jgi:hypothetical protein
MNHLFVSYARKDRGFVDDMARDLEKRGLSCWLDRQDIVGGVAWRAEIGSAIKDCSAFLLILSPASTSSENVKRELAFAESHGRAIIPIRYKPCALPPDMELSLGNLQWLDFDDSPYEDAFARLLHVIQLHLGSTAPADTAARPRQVLWISTYYLLSAVTVLLADVISLFGRASESGEAVHFFQTHSAPEVALMTAMALVDIPAAILLFRMKVQALFLLLLSCGLNTVFVALATWAIHDAPARNGAIVSYAIAIYATYYVFRLKREGKLKPLVPQPGTPPPAPAGGSTA